MIFIYVLYSLHFTIYCIIVRYMLRNQRISIMKVFKALVDRKLKNYIHTYTYLAVKLEE